MTESDVCREILCQMQQSRLTFSIRIEDFKPFEGEPVNSGTFHNVRAKSTLMAQDSLVKKESIYILNARTPYRLKIALGQQDRAESKIEQVTAVSIKTPEGEFVKLEHRTDDSSSDNTVLAFIDPERERGLEALRHPCRLFGNVDERFMPLTVKIEVVFEGQPKPAIFELPIRCRVVRHCRRLLRRRAARFLQESVAKLPTTVRKIGRNAIRFVKTLTKHLVGLG